MLIHIGTLSQDRLPHTHHHYRWWTSGCVFPRVCVEDTRNDLVNELRLFMSLESSMYNVNRLESTKSKKYKKSKQQWQPKKKLTKSSTGLFFNFFLFRKTRPKE